LRGADVGYPGRPVLNAVDLEIRPGERIALLGRSGVGKSTLLNTLYDLLADEAALIPQAAGLVPQLSCFHNVYMGRLERHGSLRNLRELVWPARATVVEIEGVLETVGLADALWQKAESLSGGQAQRTSVARALYNGRSILLGDEPVSALDRRQGSRVLETVRAFHATSILAMHDVTLALEHATRIVALQGGAIVLDAPACDLKETDLSSFYEAGR
jgi:phosphonate transport system ATP-binding protein